MRGLIETSVLPVAEHPYLYRSGRVSGTREIIAHPNYIVVYQITAERIEVVSVLHDRQEYPPHQ
jgi:toxin ParE1/3/4